MTVILVLLTFLAFVLLDIALSRRRVDRPAAVARASSVSIPPEPEPRIVDGFRVPERFRYHPGHAWLLRERKHLVRVGMDDFAAALAGAVERIDLPKPGHWIRQGQKAWTLHREGMKAEMVSPIEGEVVEVNPRVVQDPSLIRKDPYGDAWLFTAHVPDDEGTLRNLLPTRLVKSWMRDAAERLYALQPRIAGPVAADGGIASVDVFSGLADVTWEDAAREFFLA